MKPRLLSYGLVCRKEVFLESSNFIEMHLDMVVKNIEVQISVPFVLHVDEEFIEFW